MKILVITEFLRDTCQNGAEVFSREFIQRLGKRHQIDVLSRSTSDDLPGIRYAIDSDTYSDPEKVMSYLDRNVDLDDYDLVYNLGAVSFGCCMVAYLGSRLRKLPLVNHFQVLLAHYAKTENLSQAHQDIFGGSQSLAAAAASVNIFVSHDELRKAQSIGFPVDRGRVAVIPNGLEFDYSETVGTVPDSRSKDASERPITILTAGRFDDFVKGADLVFRAFARLYRDRKDLHLVAIGNSRRFAYLLEGIPGDRYTLLDWLPRDRFLAEVGAADFVVMPSRYEPFGLIALESLSLGVPVIANDTGGLSEMIHHGETGLLNPLGNGSLGLYLAMKQLAENLEEARQMGARGQCLVRKDYEIGHIAELVEKQLSRAQLSHRILEPEVASF